MGLIYTNCLEYLKLFTVKWKCIKIMPTYSGRIQVEISFKLF